MRWGVAAMRAEEVVHGALGWVIEVADVPEDGEPAGGAEDAVDLGERRGAVEPVERLSDGDGVGA
jgi:hypothetical protein